MADKDYLVVKSNRLIESGYMLTLQEFKLISACIAKLDSRKPIPESSTITASEFSELMGIDLPHAYQELKLAANRLFDRTIVLRNDDEWEDMARWVQRSAIYKRGEGKVTLYWSDIIKKHLGELQQRFTTVKLRHIGLLTSVYSVRFLELLMQFQATGERYVSLEDLRFMLQIGDKYKAYKAFRQWVIIPAINELNAKLNYTITYETETIGRKIVGLKFFFTENNQGRLDLD